MRLAGKAAVVTGAASGLGEAAARAFLREGARVIFSDLVLEQAQSVVASLGSQDALAVRCDVTREDNCAGLIEAAENFFGHPLDIFLANAGIGFAGGLSAAPIADIRRTVEINLLGSIFSAQAALRSMEKHGGGCLLFTGSLQGVMGRPARSVYTATKHAITGFAKSLALEVGPKGIRVNVIAPSAIDTEMLRHQYERVGQDVDQALARLPSSFPLQHMPTLEDFAEAAVFLASPAARSITGHTLLVDCGAAAGSFTPPTNSIGGRP